MGSSPAPPSIVVARFRLLSANLFNRFLKPDHFAEVLDRVSPDIVVAVEMSDAAAAVIGARYPNNVLRPDSRYAGWGIATLLEGRFEHDRQPWRGGSARIRVGEVDVNLAVAHISDPIFGNWRALSRQRREQVDALIAWADGLAPGEPVVIAGDMNASPAWKVYRRMADRWLDLVVEAADATGKKPAPTWGPGPNLLRIDHVFGQGLRGVEAWTEKVGGSDHSAVVIDLEVSS